VCSGRQGTGVGGGGVPRKAKEKIRLRAGGSPDQAYSMELRKKVRGTQDQKNSNWEGIGRGHQRKISKTGI